MWESEFGIKHRRKPNVNIKVKLSEWKGHKYIYVDVNGKGNWDKDRIKDENLSKERLAVKPFKLITKFGRRLSIGFNLKTAQLTLKHNGDDVESLPEVEKELRICRNKIKHSKSSDQRYVSQIKILFLPRLLIIWRVLFTE